MNTDAEMRERAEMSAGEALRRAKIKAKDQLIMDSKRSQVRNLLDRFTPASTDDDSQCQIWQGRLSVDGYGEAEIYADGRTIKFKAHRAIWLQRYGALPEDRNVLDHICRNRACVNLAHLEPVTNRENVLRGIGRTAINARKTHCKRGHPLEGENLKRPSDGSRQCKTCEANRYIREEGALLSRLKGGS
jgi:hypothetical protein